MKNKKFSNDENLHTSQIRQKLGLTTSANIVSKKFFVLPEKLFRQHE
jgi:hypothetical protein